MGSVANTRQSQRTIDLPIIDVSDTSLENGKRLVQAAIEFGFLYISPKGTKCTEALVNEQFALSKKFFASPASEKQEYHVGTDNRGWLGLHNEVLDPTKNSKEFKEAFNIGEFDQDKMPRQKMPPCLATHDGLQQLREFEAACQSTCTQIMDLIGIGLEVEDGADWFSKRHGQPSACTVRLLYYPSLPEVCLNLLT